MKVVDIVLWYDRLSPDCRKKLEGWQRALNNDEATGETGGSSQAAALLDVIRALMLDHVKTVAALEFGIRIDNRWAQVLSESLGSGEVRDHPR